MTSTTKPLPLLVWGALGAAAAVIGLLPWLVTGGALPLQNLGVTPDQPLVLLPVSQYYLTSIVALLVVGAALAGLAARILGRRRPRFGGLLLIVGVLTVQIVAACQSLLTTRPLLERSSRADVYLFLVGAVIAVSVLTGALVLCLIAFAPVPGATIGLSLVALVTASWVGVALRDILTFGPDPATTVALFVFRWLPAVLIGCAIAWCGFGTVGRVAAVVVSLAALWIGPAFFTAVSAAAGTRVLAPYPGEMAAYGVEVFRAAFTNPEIVLPPIVLAAIIGVLGALLVPVLRRRRPGPPEGDASRATSADASRSTV